MISLPQSRLIHRLRWSCHWGEVGFVDDRDLPPQSSPLRMSLEWNLRGQRMLGGLRFQDGERDCVVCCCDCEASCWLYDLQNECCGRMVVKNKTSGENVFFVLGRIGRRSISFDFISSMEVQYRSKLVSTFGDQ